MALVEVEIVVTVAAVVAVALSVAMPAAGAVAVVVEVGVVAVVIAIVVVVMVAEVVAEVGVAKIIATTKVGYRLQMCGPRTALAQFNTILTPNNKSILMLSTHAVHTPNPSSLSLRAKLTTDRLLPTRGQPVPPPQYLHRGQFQRHRINVSCTAKHDVCCFPPGS